MDSVEEPLPGRGLVEELELEHVGRPVVSKLPALEHDDLIDERRQRVSDVLDVVLREPEGRSRAHGIGDQRTELTMERPRLAERHLLDRPQLPYRGKNVSGDFVDAVHAIGLLAQNPEDLHLGLGRRERAWEVHREPPLNQNVFPVRTVRDHHEVRHARLRGDLGRRLHGCMKLDTRRGRGKQRVDVGDAGQLGDPGQHRGDLAFGHR